MEWSKPGITSIYSVAKRAQNASDNTRKTLQNFIQGLCSFWFGKNARISRNVLFNGILKKSDYLNLKIILCQKRADFVSHFKVQSSKYSLSCCFMRKVAENAWGKTGKKVQTLIRSVLSFWYRKMMDGRISRHKFILWILKQSDI